MGWFDELIEDSTDWVKEMFEKASGFSEVLVKKLIGQAVKEARLKWQSKMVDIVNDIEEEAVEEAHKLYPALDDETIRGIYWASVNKVKEKLGGAEWLIDI